MIQKFPIKTICAFVLLIFILWLWKATSSNDSGSDASLVSSLSAVSDAQAQDSGRVLIVNNKLDEQLALRLSEAAKLIDNGQGDAAVSELKAIINAQPSAVEPYINLAAYYAKSKNIELARDTLLNGIKVNKNTAVLFDSLQKVYAAQASLSYQRALEIDTVNDESLVLNLPKIDTLSLNEPSESEAGLRKSNFDLSVRVEELERMQSEAQQSIQSLEQEKNLLSSANASLKKQGQEKQSSALLALQEDNSRLTTELQGVSAESKELKLKVQTLNETNTQLTLANTDLNKNIGLKGNAQTQLDQELSGLKSNNEKLQKQLSEMERAQTQLESNIVTLQSKNDALVLENKGFESKVNQQLSVASSEQQTQAQLQRQLSEAGARLAESEKNYNERLAQLERDSASKIQALQAKLDKANASVVSSVVKAEQVSRKELDKVATDFVKSWAGAWAKQDVPAYISHYAGDFRPSSGISHSAWREQRRIRLTNKTFINVDVSNFSVKDQGDKFTVKFVQHYRSNNVDDRIQKQLVFLKNGDDWSNAKIVAEQVITQ